MDFSWSETRRRGRNPALASTLYSGTSEIQRTIIAPLLGSG